MITSVIMSKRLQYCVCFTLLLVTTSASQPAATRTAERVLPGTLESTNHSEALSLRLETLLISLTLFLLMVKIIR